MTPERTQTQILKEFVTVMFWNWSFLFGLIIGVSLFPFVAGGASQISFPPITQWYQSLIQHQNPATLKTMIPEGQSEMVSNLLTRLETIQSQQKSNPYLTPESIKSAIRESRVPMVNVKEWEPFVESFDRRINSGSSVDDVAKELDTIIKELQQ